MGNSPWALLEKGIPERYESQKTHSEIDPIPSQSPPRNFFGFDQRVIMINPPNVSLRFYETPASGFPFGGVPKFGSKNLSG